MSFPRLHMRWDGEAFTPINQFWAKVADKNLVIGEEYWCSENKERSGKSHRHYFTVIAEGWSQLPEQYSNQFTGKDGPELLRKHCLIQAGYRHETRVVFDSPKDAQRAAFMIEDRDDVERYTLASVSGSVVVKWIAESQKMKAMGNSRFQKSKSDVLEIIAGMIGISVDELTANSQADSIAA